MIINRLKNLSRADKIHSLIAIAVPLSLLLSYVLYKCFAHSLIEAIYNGNSLDVLNNLIKYQHKYSLQHYLRSGDLIAKRLVFLTVIFSTLLLLASYVVNRLIFSEKKLNFFYVMALCLLMQLLVFFLNPRWGVYYTHGFFRGSIAYQIQEGGVPPKDPLFAGETVNSPWGGPWLSAQVSQLFNITPFRAYTLINALAMCLSAFLVYKVSWEFFKDKKANVYSVFFAIFGSTIFPRHLLVWLESLLHSSRLEWRATPVFPKFLYASGDPVGLVFCLMYVYSAVQIIKNKNIWRFTLINLFSLLGCGFLYPPMLPGLVASILLLCLGYPFFAKKEIFTHSYRPVLHILTALAAAILLLVPYFMSVAGVSSRTAILNPQYFWVHLVNFTVPLFPILLLIILTKKLWFKNADIQTFTVISIVVIANTGIYFSINIPSFAEYKFFMLAAFFIALIGGVAFSSITAKLPKLLTFGLFLLFMLSPIDHLISKTKSHSNNFITNVLFNRGFTQKGTDIYVSDAEENEMYEWIKNNTDKDRIFLDSTMRLPIYAKRRMLIGPAAENELGYSLSMDLIKLRNGYNDDEYNKRRAIQQNVYGLDDTLETSYVADYLRENKILIIVRTENLGGKFDYPGLSRVFNSKQGHFQIFEAH